MPGTALQIFQKYFRGASPSCYQQDVVEQTVTNFHVWEECVKYWALNDYRPQSIGKLLDYYTKECKAKADLYVGRSETTTAYVPDPPCNFCGKDICLDLHREERLGIN